MTLSKQAVLRRVLDALRQRGWTDPGDWPVYLVSQLASVTQASDLDRELSTLVPSAFLVRNGITRSQVVDVVMSVLPPDGVTNDNMAESVRTLQLRILFLVANPVDQLQLALDEEYRDIQRRLRATDMREQIHFASRWAARSSDLLDALNEERPHVLHFSGHGSALNELTFKDDSGASKSVTVDAMVAALGTLGGHLRLAVFNSCYSESVAAGVVRHIDSAIGMSTAISDEAARVFAARFYSSLGYGLPLDRAYDQAIAELLIEGLSEADTPRLYTRTGVRPSEVIFVE